VGIFALLCAATWHVIGVDQMQVEEELLHAAGVETKDTWPEISNRLCPNMKPKFQLERTIF
jgi:hypothetical protein